MFTNGYTDSKNTKHLKFLLRVDFKRILKNIVLSRFFEIFDIHQKLMLKWLNNLENGSLRNIENLQYKKSADSVFLSLFMRTNGNCNNSHDP